MFRLPSLREIFALFFSPRTISGATQAITGAISALDAVAEHHADQADAKGCKAGLLRSKASVLDAAVADHQAELGKAAAIATKLESLVTP